MNQHELLVETLCGPHPALSRTTTERCRLALATGRRKAEKSSYARALAIREVQDAAREREVSGQGGWLRNAVAGLRRAAFGERGQK